MKEKLLAEFSKIFGNSDGAEVFFAPGRVNLIGEHTDYNGGHVFPCALTIGTYGVARKREDRKLRFYSMNFSEEGVLESDISSLEPNEKDGWTAYPKGMFWIFLKKGYQVDFGMDLLVYGNIPNGSGLSSSASIEVLTGYILNYFLKAEISNLSLAKMGQYSENQYNGVNCGIMDQFAVAMGKKDHAMFLDTNTLKYEYVPVKLDGVKLVIGCTNKVRKLGESKYNERRKECEQALADLQKVVSIQALGELTEEAFEKYADAIQDETCCRRARHAVTENQRTIQAVEALTKNDLVQFGKLMNASHISLWDDYEVTGAELDTLVEAAWKQEGVLGARMTGAGFGGSTVCLVKEENVEDFIRNTEEAYQNKIGYAADFYVAEIGNGPVVL